MWFKQATLFQFSKPFSSSISELNDLLKPLAFTPCLPSFSSSIGWISPLGQAHQELVYGSKRFLLIALQFEEKILPATVVRQAVIEKIAEIEAKEARSVRGKEKQTIKDEMMQTLLPRAFSKKSMVTAYIDLKEQRLVLNSSTPSKVERFIAFFKRAIAPTDLHSVEVKKPINLMTDWLKGEAIPRSFEIGQACLMRDPQQEKRMIRCQHQDLFSANIQAFLKEECEVMSLAMVWKEQVKFTLTGEFSLRGIQFQEAVLSLAESDYTETAEQRFDADFVLMTELMSQLLDDLLQSCLAEAPVAA
ncbi:MAG: recombination-associated protein RdgC [Coxiellaceae bacterium]|nr:recombination-associated protein RdgC [Coxiellaceae bacterium]